MSVHQPVPPSSHPPIQWPLVAVACIIEKDGKYLLVQEGHAFARGMWNHPAGLLDLHERFEDGARREAREETGYNVELLGVLAVENLQKMEHRDNLTPPRQVVKIVFAAKTVGDAGTSADEGEIMDMRWFTMEEITRMRDEKKLRDMSVPALIERWEAGELLPLSLILEFTQ